MQGICDQLRWHIGCWHIVSGEILLSYSRIVAILLSTVLCFEPMVCGQQAGAPAPSPGGIRILVLEGQNALNSITGVSAISPVVQVLDNSDQPVMGATVTFEVLPTGPGGSFGGRPMASVRSDSTGQATARFTPNGTAGDLSIKATAVFSGQTAVARIRQRNAERILEATIQQPSKAWYKKWQWWAVIGAGAGAGVAVALVMRDSSKSSVITISPGSVVFGGQ